MLPESELPWFEEHGPDFLLKRIEAPTLIAQGTVDTLFTLDEAPPQLHGAASGRASR